MRKSIAIFCAAILAFCVWLILHKTKQTEQSSQAFYEMPTNQQQFSAQPAQLRVLAQSRGTNASMPTKIPMVKKTPWPTAEEFSQQALAEWQKPIEFYGKVVDENTNPVEGASIQFRWFGFADKSDQSTTISDADGLFSLQGKQGRSLEVSVGKDGYYNSRKDETDFLYSLGPGIYSPEEWNPVIFHLRKKGQGADLIQKDFPPGFTQIWQLHHDGTPIELDLLNGSRNVGGSGQLKLEFWRDISDLHKQPFDWKLQLSVSGGGLTPIDEEFAFQAPESGYQPSVVIDMPVTNQDWLSELRAKYYIQLPNGDYGRLDFYLLPYNGVFTVKSWVNPTGSRNLEPAN